MAKVSAEQFSREGDKYIGRKYEDIDCQEFYERCLQDAGIKKDLKGSNAWYREFLKNGWVGSPEDCKKKFGSVPKGATLFIHAFDGGEEKRGYHDGLGNASHIGIKTGRSGADMTRATGRTDMDFGDGAEHSSSTRKGVCTSNFKDETIKGGGWNTVGLHPLFTYGEKIDRILEDNCGGGTDAGKEKQEEGNMKKAAYLEGGNSNKPVNIRKKPDGDLKEQLPQGTEVSVIDTEGDWYKIQYSLRRREYTGYVIKEFVTLADGEPIADDSGLPAEDPAGFYDEDEDEKEMVTLSFSVTAEQAAILLPALEKLVQEIINKVGRG